MQEFASSICAVASSRRVGDECFYTQELFEKEEFTGHLKNTMESEKSVYDRIAYDSAGVEKEFAQNLEKNEAVKVYAKLPGWFKVPTPLGTYNPDWAVLVEDEGKEKLYFVVETKGSLFDDELRDREGGKIKCGAAHFTALAGEVDAARYVVARSVDDVFAKL